MICELVKRGKKIGVTALSHKVIRNLLDAVVEAAQEKGVAGVRCMHRETSGEESDGVAVAKKNNDEALEALRSGKANVLGGTSWLWSPEPSFEAVDVLFIDEAGQMSLADVLAVSQSAKKLVLAGRPATTGAAFEGEPPGRSREISSGASAEWAEDHFGGYGLSTAGKLETAPRGLQVYFLRFL